MSNKYWLSSGPYHHPGRACVSMCHADTQRQHSYFSQCVKICRANRLQTEKLLAKANVAQSKKRKPSRIPKNMGKGLGEAKDQGSTNKKAEDC